MHHGLLALCCTCRCRGGTAARAARRSTGAGLWAGLMLTTLFVASMPGARRGGAPDARRGAGDAGWRWRASSACRRWARWRRRRRTSSAARWRPSPSSPRRCCARSSRTIRCARMSSCWSANRTAAARSWRGWRVDPDEDGRIAVHAGADAGADRGGGAELQPRRHVRSLRRGRSASRRADDRADPAAQPGDHAGLGNIDSERRVSSPTREVRDRHALDHANGRRSRCRTTGRASPRPCSDGSASPTSRPAQGVEGHMGWASSSRKTLLERTGAVGELR